MCRSLGVSRSWLYQKPALAEPTEEDTSLRDAIERLCLAFPGYGYRRVTAQLHRDGCSVNHKRVLRIMQTESLLCRLQRAFVPPSPGSTRAAYPNLLKDLVVTRLDQVWVVDITYIRLPQGFVYLACVLDALQPPLHRLAPVQRHRHAPDARGPGRGDRGPPPARRSDPSLGPGRSVRQRGVRRPLGRGRGLHQHEQGGLPL